MVGWNVLRRGDQINLEQKNWRRLSGRPKRGRKTGKLKIRKMGVTMTVTKRFIPIR